MAMPSSSALVVVHSSLVVRHTRKEFAMRLAFTTLACPTWISEQVAEATNRYGYTGLELL